MKPILPVLLVPLTLAITLPAAARNLQIGLRMEYYEVDHLTAHALISQPTGGTDATKLRNTLLGKVSEGEARLVDSSYVVTRSGQRAKVESVTEWIYPTEFDPPETPQNLKGPINSGVDLVTPLTSTAYNTRNLGHTFEVDPVIGPDGVTIDINLAPELVVRIGDTTYGQAEAELVQPVFHMIKNSTAVVMRSGTWALLGIHTPPPETADAPDTGKRVIPLLNAEVIFAGNANSGAKAALQRVEEDLEFYAHETARSGLDKEEALKSIAEMVQRLSDDYPDYIDKNLRKKLRSRYQRLVDYYTKYPSASDGRQAPDPFADPAPPVPPHPFASTAPHTPSQIAIHQRWYQLPAAIATKLLDKHGGPYSDATPLLESLDNLVSKQRATLVDSAYVVTRSGQRAKSESVSEWIFRTAGDPPEIAQSLTGPIDPATQIITHVACTSFDTRNIGTILEVDPVIGPDGLTIDINLVPEIVRLGTMVHYGQKESRIKMPIFYTVRNSTAVTLHSGTSVLLGMHTPMPDDVTAPNFGSDQRVLSIVSARIIKAD